MAAVVITSTPKRVTQMAHHEKEIAQARAHWTEKSGSSSIMCPINADNNCRTTLAIDYIIMIIFEIIRLCTTLLFLDFLDEQEKVHTEQMN